MTYIFNLSVSNNKIPSIWKSAYVLPLLKGVDPTTVNNYRPVSKLCVLAKVLEKFVSEQLKDYLIVNGLLSQCQSGFQKHRRTVTVAIKVVNDIIDALDSKKYCAALFIDLSKAFDTVDHVIVFNILRSTGLSAQAVNWFLNYLSNRSQCVQSGGYSSPSSL